MKNLLSLITLFLTTITIAQTDTTKNSEEVFMLVEQMPTFPGFFTLFEFSF